MSFFEAFHFIRPAWLLLIPIVVWLWWLARKSQDPLRGWHEVMEPELLEAMTVGRIANPSDPSVRQIANSSDSLYGRIGNPSQLWRGTGQLVAWLLAVVAVAGPTWRPEPSPFADDPVPAIVVLRAGESMEQADLVPSRMERARLKVADFAAERKGQPMGLVAYAGSSHLVLPPTRDTDVIATMAAEISPAIMPKQGDDLAGALRIAAKALGESGGSLVVFTDNVTPEAERDLREFRAENKLPIHFLAIARNDTPELDAIRRAASAVNASVTLMTPDTADIQSLVRSAANAPIAIAAADEGTRWEEAGWWLVPILAVLCLFGFRRVQNHDRKEAIQ